MYYGAPYGGTRQYAFVFGTCYVSYLAGLQGRVQVQVEAGVHAKRGAGREDWEGGYVVN